MYVFENNSFRPEKASGTRWIDHKMRATGKLSDKFGVYIAHLGNIIADTSKQCDCATLQAKHNKLIEANVLLRSAFLSDLLLPAKALSPSTQKENTDIITIANLVRITHEKYIKLGKIYSSHPENFFEQMPTLKDVLSNIDDQSKDMVIKETTEGDRLLSHICKVLSSKIWPNEVSNVEEVLMKEQLSSIKAVYDQYCRMPIFQSTSFQQIKEGYLQIVRYAATFFPVHLIPPLKLWQNMFELSTGDNDKDDWKPVLLIVELVMCAPQSNAAIERFFSQLNYIKTNTHTSLSSISPNSLLRVKLQVRHYKSIIINMWRRQKIDVRKKSTYAK